MINFITKNPREGSHFEFELVAENSKVFVHEIRASINGREVYNKRVDCVDPPCHEMFFINKGGKLHIEYKNNMGKVEHFDLPILPELTK